MAEWDLTKLVAQYYGKTSKGQYRKVKYLNDFMAITHLAIRDVG
jgi:hypothetical protein